MDDEFAHVTRVRPNCLEDEVPYHDPLNCEVGSVREVWERLYHEGYYISEELLSKLVKKKAIPSMKDGRSRVLICYDQAAAAIRQAISG